MGESQSTTKRAPGMLRAVPGNRPAAVGIAPPQPSKEFRCARGQRIETAPGKESSMTVHQLSPSETNMPNERAVIVGAATHGLDDALRPAGADRLRRCYGRSRGLGSINRLGNLGPVAHAKPYVPRATASTRSVPVKIREDDGVLIRRGFLSKWTGAARRCSRYQVTPSLPLSGYWLYRTETFYEVEKRMREY